MCDEFNKLFDESGNVNPQTEPRLTLTGSYVTSPVFTMTKNVPTGGYVESKFMKNEPVKIMSFLCPDCTCILGKAPEMFHSCPQCGTSFSFSKPVEKWVYHRQGDIYPIRLLTDDEIRHETCFVKKTQSSPANPDVSVVIKECADILKQNVPEHVNEAAYTKCCNDLAKTITSLLQVPPILAALDEYKRTVGKEMALMQLDLLTAKLNFDTLEREKQKLITENFDVLTKLDRANEKLASIRATIGS